MKTTLALLLLAFTLVSCGDEAPTALPDPAPHDTIIYSHYLYAGNSEIVRSLSDGTGRQVVISTGKLVTRPVAGKILYLGQDNMNLYTAGLDGSNPTIVRSANYPMFQNGAISPDGQTFACVDWISGRPELAIWRMSGNGSPTTIATDIRTQSRPTFSPDGRKIAFFANDNRVYTINVDGTGRRAITAAPGSTQRDDSRIGFSPEWSPSGEWIAVESLSEEMIDIIRADGGSPASLPSFRGAFPSWSSDGQEISCIDNGWIVIHPINGTSQGVFNEMYSSRFDKTPLSPDRRRLLNKGDDWRTTVTLMSIDIGRKESTRIENEVFNAYWLP